MEDAGLDTFDMLSKLRRNGVNPRVSSSWKDRLLFDSFQHPLDRVNVLGDTESGHSGCVNALSWAKDGELLLSGGDDTTVRVWRMDMSNTTREYPFVCDAVIRTGHRANIFNVQMLPQSSRIVTVAGDKQVRVSDIGDIVVGTGVGKETEYTWRQAGVQVLRCHTSAVKRITTEHSPDLFLTVSEDGSVRQHDLRVAHNCLSGSCPVPLVKVNHSLCTMSMSSLTPYQFVVAGESPYGYLFDRRQLGRHLMEEWGVPPDSAHVTTCVRKFGRLSRSPNESEGFEHITGCRMATSNGHEVLLSYSTDAVYLYSTRDAPLGSSEASSQQTNILPPNLPPTSGHSQSASGSADGPTQSSRVALNDLMEEDIEQFLCEERRDTHDESGSPVVEYGEDEEIPAIDDDDDDDDAGSERYGPSNDEFPNVSVVLPRTRFAGVCNVETVKDVNFVGPRDDFVVSGSDDGHFFVWNKATGKLHDILEGDGHVVNVVESHPHLPVVAVSGIDTTVKLFAPAHGESSFSRIRNATSIMDRNAEAASRRIDLTSLMIYARIARRVGINDEQCRHQ